MTSVQLVKPLSWPIGTATKLMSTAKCTTGRPSNNHNYSNKESLEKFIYFVVLICSILKIIGKFVTQKLELTK